MVAEPQTFVIEPEAQSDAAILDEVREPEVAEETPTPEPDDDASVLRQELAELKAWKEAQEKERQEAAQKAQQESQQGELTQLVQSLAEEAETIQQTITQLWPSLSDEEQKRMDKIGQWAAAGKLVATPQWKAHYEGIISERDAARNELRAYKLAHAKLGPNTSIARAQEFAQSLLGHKPELLDDAAEVLAQKWRTQNIRARQASGVEMVEGGQRAMSGAMDWQTLLNKVGNGTATSQEIARFEQMTAERKRAGTL